MDSSARRSYATNATGTRAIIARDGLLALSAREAVYFSLYTDEHDRPLSESCIYELNGPPLDAPSFDELMDIGYKGLIARRKEVAAGVVEERE